MIEPRGRDLERPELEEVVGDLARRPQLWEHLISPNPAARTYEQLHRDEHLSVWLICWATDSDTGFHDHDLSSGAVAVAEGKVREERLAVGREASARVVGPGGSFSFGASDIHRVLHEEGRPAVTLHAYSPALWRMGAYMVEPDGTLTRHSLSYAEELRPLEAA
jgi:predicted metal-dependent enzyme (double-stranded beta helix superfamily)